MWYTSHSAFLVEAPHTTRSKQPTLMEPPPTAESAPGRRCGAFAVALQALTWEALDAASVKERQVWAFVQIAQPLERIWFDGEDENMFTKSVVLPPVGSGRGFRPNEPPSLALDYSQSSRAVPLTSEALQELVRAQLRVSLYSGTTRTRATGKLLGEASVPLVGAFLEAELQQKVRIATSTEAFVLDLVVQCDVELADFALGARVLRLQSPRILNLPAEWTLAGCASNEEALRACTSGEQNAACFELEIALPQLGRNGGDDSGRGEGEETPESPYRFEVFTLRGGKLLFEAASPDADDIKVVEESPIGGGEQEEERPPTPVAALSGVWSVCFPDTAIVSKLYVKVRKQPRLLEFLTVEKHVGGTLRRCGTDFLNGKAIDVVSAAFRLHLHQLLAPGTTQIRLQATLRTVESIPRATLEQELAGAVSNDDKKKYQAALADYDATVQQATELSTAVTSAGTQVEGIVEVLYAPLVPRPPETLEPPSRSIEELITPRDLSIDYEKQPDAFTDLRTEIRLVVVALLREYEGAFRSNGDKKQEDEEQDIELAAPRDDKKQTLIYRLNTQGVYHSFKESLKKRIVPVIRERFARSEAAADEEEDEDRPQTDEKTVEEKKKEQFGQIYTLVMEEVHAILHETFYSDSDAQLEKEHAKFEGRPTPKEVAFMLEMLRVKAMENEVSGDAEKSEMLHLDRIAYAEQHTANVQLQTPTQGHTDVEGPSASQLRTNAWYDYARFCVARTKLEKAGAALQQCLRLDPHELRALLALVALQCELRDYARVEALVKNAVVKAQVKARMQGGRVEDSALAHALFAFFFSQFEGRDPTGNLTLLELLKAQQMLRLTVGGDGHTQITCVSAVWLFLAEYAHEWKLWRLAQAALQLAERYQKPHDVISGEQRVMKRVIEAELRLQDDEGDSITRRGCAVKLLQEALEIHASHPVAWLTLGKVYLESDTQAKTAIECLQRALEHREALRSEAQRLALYLRLGLALLHSSQFEAAEATFLQAGDEFRVASTWLGVGIASLRLERWERAQMALAEANRLDATNPDVWGYLALFVLSAHTAVTPRDEQDGQQFVAQALRHNLSNPALLRELSNAFVAIDRLESAEKLLRRSLACQDSSLTRKTLADVLAAQNCAEDALRQYAQSLNVTEDVEERCILLEKCARLLTTLGKPEEAGEYRAMAKQFHADTA
ncbi:hypothetical protein BBJ28_00012511 [Nothophytophthora sp. Chile5]|nr:hypothetical protein BBJ28_00012511 [Nothophytophthora sp. Chile5]